MRAGLFAWALALSACSAGAPPTKTRAPTSPPAVATTHATDGASVRLLSVEPPSEPAPAASGAAAAEPPRASFREPIAPRSETRVVVLLYHAFNRGPQPLSVRATDFDEQLGWLEDNHVEIVSTSELVSFVHGELDLPARAAVITIDDGLASVYEHAWPVLRRRGVKFTLGLPTGTLEEPKNAPVMTWAQVNEMVASGLCELASHGHLHRSLVNLSGPKLREEIELSAELIGERTGRAPVAYFYPLGAYDAHSSRALKGAGYRAAFRASGAPIAAGSGSPYWLPRVSVFHGEGGASLSRFFANRRFLGQVSYDPKRDPKNRSR